MSRARVPNHLREFVSLHPEVEGVVQHVGLRTYDLVLIDVQGAWVRDEFPDEAAAEAVCRALGISMHRGWDDPRLSRRMMRRDDWSRPDGQRRAR